MLTLLPLFLIAATAVGVEIALTRFFAVASWSEYGYWVISIAMMGFAVSGVVMVLGRQVFLRHAGWLLPSLPLAMLLTGAAGWIATTGNGFNPLELQNPATAWPQLGNIARGFGRAIGHAVGGRESRGIARGNRGRAAVEAIAPGAVVG